MYYAGGLKLYKVSIFPKKPPGNPEGFFGAVTKPPDHKLFSVAKQDFCDTRLAKLFWKSGVLFVVASKNNDL